MGASSTPEVLPVLKNKLELLDSADQLSIGDALKLTKEIVKLAQDAASSLEAGGDLAGAAALYGDVAEALEEAFEKVPEKDRELLAPLTDFWSVTAKLKRDSLPIVSETGETEVLLLRGGRHISVKTRLPEQIGAVLREQEGRAIVRNSRLSEQIGAVLHEQEGKTIVHRSRLGIGKKGIAFKKGLGKG